MPPIPSDCALCLQPKPLCKSHIIPRSMFKPLRDAKHEATKINIERPSRPSKTRTGFWERLLCAGCEGILNPFETHACEVIFHDRFTRRRVSNDLFIMGALDYAKFKLYYLSVLWRGHVSKAQEFRTITLGPHGETLRQMILAADPGPVEHYGLHLKELTHGGTRLRDFISAPQVSKPEGHTVYRLIFGGFEWNVWVSSHRTGFENTFLALSGDIPVKQQPLIENDIFQRAQQDYQQNRMRGL